MPNLVRLPGTAPRLPVRVATLALRPPVAQPQQAREDRDRKQDEQRLVPTALVGEHGVPGVAHRADGTARVGER